MILVTAAKAPLEAEWSGHSERQMEGTVVIRKTKKKKKKGGNPGILCLEC